MRLLPLLLLLLCAVAQAQDAPPPPPLDTTEIDAAADALAPPPPPRSAPPPPDFEQLPPKQRPPDAVQPEVSIRPGTDGGRVEEYRENGRLLYVRVVPERGIPYVLIDSDNDGEVDRAPPGTNEVLPVFYDIKLPKRDPENDD